MTNPPLPPPPPPAPRPPTDAYPTTSRPSAGCGIGLGLGLALGGVIAVLLIGGLLLGLLLPALAKARSAAQTIKSSTQLSMIAKAMEIYASDNNGARPEVGADLVTRLGNLQLVSAPMWTSPFATTGAGEPSYLVVFAASAGSGPAGSGPAGSGPPGAGTSPAPADALRPVLMENPTIVPSRVAVVYADGHVATLTIAEALALLRQPDAAPHTPEGKPWTPPPP